MQRGLVHAAAWTLATGAAVTLSWFGVHTVLSGTAYDAPRALPLSDQAASSAARPDDGATPQVSSTHRPKPSPPASHSPSPAGPTSSATPSRTGGGASRSPGGGASGGWAPDSGGSVRSYATNGGRVVFDLGGSAAELVSATPNSGWEMQVWKQYGWIRVDFTSGSARTSVICTWNGHPPTVQTDNHAT
ncbi:hypothetical protein AB0C96_18390 [Streptomyces sp. NPDC048506]|uniref:hypothetical protein n=1 Tax=Streptomyces sp. NPDC048506 TaxID=3155028 RepID=UPI00342CAC94